MAKKKNGMKVMTIKTVEDLVALVNHNTHVIDRAVRKVTKSSRTAKVFGAVALAYAIYAAAECRRQEEELYRLSIRVKKLENKEGE